jgi:hypothetical protein
MHEAQSPIPVYVQPPNRPQDAHLLGYADQDVPKNQVIAQFKLDANRLLDAKVRTFQGEVCWLIVSI